MIPAPNSPLPSSLPIVTRRSDGARFRIVLQARSPDGPVHLTACDGPPFERVVVGGRDFTRDFIDPQKVAPPTVAELARVAFDAYGQSTGGKTWDGKDIPPFAVVAERTPHVARAWEAAVAAVLRAHGVSA